MHSPRARAHHTLAVALLPLALAGCSDDGAETASPPSVSARFDLSADLTLPASFYSLPFPSDLRLSPSGGPDLEGMPHADAVAASSLLWSAAQRPGFSALSVAFFQFDSPIPPQQEQDVIAAEASSPLLLIDVDPASPDRGTLYPTIAYTPPPDAFVPEHLLAVGPYPGIVLRADRTYAFVVHRSFGDATGAPLGVPPELAELAAGATPAGARGPGAAQLYQPLWDSLDSLGIARTEIAAATVFTVGAVVEQTLAQSEAVLAEHAPAITNLALDAADGATHPRFCELHGQLTVPQFQVGTPPFDSEGQIELSAAGAPIQQGEQTIDVVVTIPKMPMPAGGYPLLLYIHGSGGLSSQVVDRGKTTTAQGQPIVGEGPAHVVAEHGIAAASAAMPLNPERLAGATDYGYINFENPGSFPFTFRQGVYEQRLFLRALLELSIDPALLAGCDGPTLPGGAATYQFDATHVYGQGQSMGAQYINLIAAVEPLILAVVPTGSGSYWSLMLMESLLFGGTKPVAAATVGANLEGLSHLHPAMQLLQMSWDPGDALEYVPYLALHPLADFPTRSIYDPVAPGDLYWSQRVFNAMAMGFGTAEAGDVEWASMQDALAMVGRDGLLSYPVQDNGTSEAGEAYTGVTVQYQGDGIVDPHNIAFQLDQVKYQYGCFLASHAKNGTAVVPAPAPLGTPCPE